MILQPKAVLPGPNSSDSSSNIESLTIETTKTITGDFIVYYEILSALYNSTALSSTQLEGSDTPILASSAVLPITINFADDTKYPLEDNNNNKYIYFIKFPHKDSARQRS